MRQLVILLRLVEVVAAASALVLLFAFFTWRRVLSHRALLSFVISATVVVALLAPSLALVLAPVCILLIVLFAQLQRRGPRLTSNSAQDRC